MHEKTIGTGTRHDVTQGGVRCRRRQRGAALIRATSVLREGEAMINWPRALAQLEQLLTALPTGAARMPALAIELVEDDDDLMPLARRA